MVSDSGPGQVKREKAIQDSIQPLIIPDYGQALLDLRSRLKSTRWTEASFAGAEETGMPVSFLQDLCASWKDEFDWESQVRRFSAFSQDRYLRNGFGIHFLLQRGHGPSPIPLIVTHSWPGSFLEMLKLIPLLAEPGRHRPADSDAFDVVVPSLPGFGFSDHAVPSGVNVFSTARRSVCAVPIACSAYISTTSAAQILAKEG